MNIKKKIKILYYIQSYYRILLGNKNTHQKLINRLKSQLNDEQTAMVMNRVSYYCKDFTPNKKAKNRLQDLKRPKTPKSYYFDTYEYARFFDENLPIDFVFGDVTHIPDTPSIVKSRPISDDNQNSILLNLDKARHFVWVKNDKPFLEKKNILIGRGGIYQKHRYDFYEKYFTHPLCDLGAVGKVGITREEWIKPKISIAII